MGGWRDCSIMKDRMKEKGGDYMSGEGEGGKEMDG